MKWTKDTSTTFGRRLQRIREARGLTQAELATAIGKSAQTISAWENGAGIKVQGSDVYKCAQTLLCRVSDLLAPVEAPVPLCPFWARVKKRLRRLAVRSSLADKS
jgi:transcriptional regulator with XRE-family HTH domain